MASDREIAKQLTATAGKIISTERGQQHGELEPSFRLIAEWWTSYINHRRSVSDRNEISAVDVLEMMALVKKARNLYGKPVPDHSVDDIGYTALAGGLRLSRAVNTVIKEEATDGVNQQDSVQAQGFDAVAAALNDPNNITAVGAVAAEEQAKQALDKVGVEIPKFLKGGR